MFQQDLYPLLLTYLQPCERASHDNRHTVESCINAVEIGHVEYLQLHLLDMDYHSLVDIAVMNDQLEIVKFFAVNYNVTATMFTAARYGKTRIIEYLSALGQYPSGQDMIVAATGNHLDAVRVLARLGIPEFDAALVGASTHPESIETIRLLIELGATDIERAIQLATVRGNIKIVEYLTGL